MLSRIFFRISDDSESVEPAESFSVLDFSVDLRAALSDRLDEMGRASLL